jgi:hypothetical protein
MVERFRLALISATSATSPALSNPDKMSGSTSTTRQRPTPVGSDDAADAQLPKEYAQFNCFHPQNSTTTVSASGREGYDSPYQSRGTINPVSQSTSNQLCTSNRPGSSRLSPVEIDDDSDHPLSPDVSSPDETFIAANTTSSETGKHTIEPGDKTVAAEVQLRPAIPSSPGKRSNVHSLLIDTTDNFMATTQPVSATKLQSPSDLQPQSMHIQHDPLPARHPTHTGNNSRAQLSSVRGTPGWITYARQPQTPTTADSEPSEPFQSPKGGETPQREVAPGSPSPFWEVHTPGPLDTLRMGLNNRIVPVGKLQDTWTQWQPKGVAASKSKSAMSDHQPSKASPTNINVMCLSPQRGTKNSPHKTSPSHQPGSHIRAESSSGSYPSTASAFPSSVNTRASSTDHDTLIDVDGFTKDINDFIMKEKNSSLQRENSVEPVPCQNNRLNLARQSPQPLSPTPTRAAYQDRAIPSQPHQVPSRAATEGSRVPSSLPQDKIPMPGNRAVMPSQEPITPPAEDITPDRRNGSYAFLPPPIPFSPYEPGTTPPTSNVPPTPLSTDRRLTCSTSSSSHATPTLTLLIESADGNMSLETTHPFNIVKNSSLAEFFLFYASVSGTPISKLTSLKFLAAFGKSQSFEVRRYGGENVWRRLKAVMPTLFKEAVRQDKEGEMEWQVLVSGE